MRNIRIEQKFRKIFVYRTEENYYLLCCNKKKMNSRILIINRRSKDLDLRFDSYGMDQNLEKIRLDESNNDSHLEKKKFLKATQLRGMVAAK